MTAPPVEAVLFDIDGTLVEYERTAGDLLPLAFEATGVDPFFRAADYQARYGAFAAESEDVQDLRERCFVDIARQEGRDPEVGRAVARAYAAERDHTRVDLLPDAQAALLEQLSLAVCHLSRPYFFLPSLRKIYSSAYLMPLPL